MPKKWKGRLEDIVSLENVQYAYRVAKRTTKKNRIVQYYGREDIQQDLIKRVSDVNTYYPKPSYCFDLLEQNCGKVRHIEAPHFETKIVEHMIIAVFGEQMRNFLYPYSCASIKERGIEKARKRVLAFSKLPKKQKKYYVQGDISKFFPSIHKEVALEEYKRHIKDTRVVTLIEHLMPYEIGQPLGNSLVQFTANLVLARFDGECLKWSKHYVRYMDDFVLLFSKKRTAQRFIAHILKWVKDSRKLTIKSAGKCSIQIWQWSKRPIDIAGYKTSYTGVQKIRKTTLGKIYKLVRLRSYSILQARTFVSLAGWTKHSSCYQLQKQYKPQLRKLKRIISEGDKHGTMSKSRYHGNYRLACRY